MLTEYVQAAMERARYKLLDGDSFFGEIPACPGVWANEPTLEHCRETLREVLEEWLVLRLRQGARIPRFGHHQITASHLHPASRA